MALKGFIRAFRFVPCAVAACRIGKISRRKAFIYGGHASYHFGWHVGRILIKDFTALYTGKELPGIRIHYKDYAEWQNGKAGKFGTRDYWAKEFEGEIPVLELPTDYAKTNCPEFRRKQYQFEINKEITGIKTLTLETGTTLYMVLLALYTIFLAKLSSQEDIVIGSPIAGRRHADLEKIIGMFVNTLALRNYPVGEKTIYRFPGGSKRKNIKSLRKPGLSV